MNVCQLIKDFLFFADSNNIEIYNEFSLQHELGVFLRTRLKNDYKIQFERNTKYFFGADGNDTIKHEIDIVIFNADMTEKYAIELKHPLNGQYPEQMYSFVKDIKFMEELKDKGFDSTYCFTLVDDINFYSGNNQNGIYSYFRGSNTLRGRINKPTGNKSEVIELKNNYKIDWQGWNKKKYYLIEI